MFFLQEGGGSCYVIAYVGLAITSVILVDLFYNGTELYHGHIVILYNIGFVGKIQLLYVNRSL
jgi:hypothetical protein